MGGSPGLGSADFSCGSWLPGGGLFQQVKTGATALKRSAEEQDAVIRLGPGPVGLVSFLRTSGPRRRGEGCEEAGG